MQLGQRNEIEKKKQKEETKKILDDNPCSIVDYVNIVQHGKQLLQSLIILQPNKVITVYSSNPASTYLRFVPNKECYSNISIPKKLMSQRDQIANMRDIIIDTQKCSITVECECNQNTSELCSIVDYTNVVLYGKQFLQSLIVLNPVENIDIYAGGPAKLKLKNIDGEKSVQVKIPKELISQRDQIAGMTEIVFNEKMRTITAYF